MDLLASITPSPPPSTKPLFNHVSVNMPYLAVYAHTSLGLVRTFLQECAGALPVLFSLPTSRLLTQRMWCICSGCVLSVVTPLEFCCSHSFEPEEALTAAAAAARSSWKQLQKCERKGRRKGIFILLFFLRSPLPSPLPPNHVTPTRPSTRLKTCYGPKNMCEVDFTRGC